MVTPWYAETADGKCYAVRETRTGRWWNVIFKDPRRAIRTRVLGFRAAAALAAQWVAP